MAIVESQLLYVIFCKLQRQLQLNFQANIIQNGNCQGEKLDSVPLVNPIIDLERSLEKERKKGKYKAIKYYNTPGDDDSGSYEINLPYYGGGTPEEWLVWKDKLLKSQMVKASVQDVKEMTDYFESRVENLKLKKDKKKS